MSHLFDPYLQYTKDQPPPYADYMFKCEERTHNGERKEFYIRIDPAWVDAVLDAELECENEPAPVEFQLKGMNWFANIRWSDEHKGYVARVPALYRCAVLGDSIEDAKAKIQKAAEEWQESELDKWERPEARPILG
ncbi:MAG: hypothetical protein EOP84_00565 [Verrucomicrobiaceae bacterium]|nr:MAG: hypothetical protein EOP84_00565 [Verrucomicrobiaceae bacterium]